MVSAHHSQRKIEQNRYSMYCTGVVRDREVNFHASVYITIGQLWHGVAQVKNGGGPRKRKR